MTSFQMISSVGCNFTELFQNLFTLMQTESNFITVNTASILTFKSSKNVRQDILALIMSCFLHKYYQIINCYNEAHI